MTFLPCALYSASCCFGVAAFTLNSSNNALILHGLFSLLCLDVCFHSLYKTLYSCLILSGIEVTRVSLVTIESCARNTKILCEAARISAMLTGPRPYSFCCSERERHLPCCHGRCLHAMQHPARYIQSSVLCSKHVPSHPDHYIRNRMPVRIQLLLR